MTKAIILIEVQGGMAEVVGCSKDIQFEIRDLDGGEGREGHEDAFSKKQIKEAKQSRVSEKEFPNGFTAWMETHHEVVAAIRRRINIRPHETNVPLKRREKQGMGGLYELAEELTDKFEKKNAGRKWDGEFFEEIEQFLLDELND